MTLLRSIVFVIWLYGTMLFIGLAFLPFVAFNDNYVWPGLRTWTRSVLWGLRWIIGARVVVEGQENIPKGGALIAMKHQAMIDTMVPSLFLPKTVFVYKKELNWTPILGLYLSRNQLAIDRGGHATALKSMVRGAREAVSKERQIIIFPEGTRQELDAPPDYKPGIAALYKDLELPVTPIALNTGMVWKPKGIIRLPGVVTFKILPPIPPGMPRAEFMRVLEERIETASQALLPPELRRKGAT